MARVAPPLEAATQKAIVDAIRATVHPCTVFAIPNGSKRTLWQQRQAKSDGVLKGVPDLCIVWPGGIGWIEVKREGYTLGAVSHEQRALIEQWRGWGMNVAIASSVDSALSTLALWGAPVLARGYR